MICKNQFHLHNIHLKVPESLRVLCLWKTVLSGRVADKRMSSGEEKASVTGDQTQIKFSPKKNSPRPKILDIRRMAWEEDKAWVAGSAPRERSLTPHNSLRVKSELFFINFDFNKYIFWHNSTINSTQILNFQISKINLAGQIVR